MATKSRRKGVKDHVKVRGFFRIQITEGDPTKPETIKIVGDSGVDENGELINGDGLRENLVTAAGFQQYLALTLAGSAGSKTVSHMGLGTSGAPASNETVLGGEITHSSNCRVTVSPTTAVSLAGYKVSFLGTFASGSFLTANANLSNIGLFNTSLSSDGATRGTVFAGAAYTSSTVASNNNVNATYAIIFQ